MILGEEGAQHLSSAVPEKRSGRRKRRRRKSGSTRTAASRDQAAQRAPAAQPVPPPSAASGHEELGETFQRLGQLCRLARLPTGPSRKTFNPCSAVGIALPKPKLKTLVGLAYVIHGVFSSLEVLGQLVAIPSVGGLCDGILKAVCLHMSMLPSLGFQGGVQGT